ncbi:MAG: acyltransferase family protein [Opitutales bacterium]
MRYLSDSSYWQYLWHLPVIGLVQYWIIDRPWPSFVKLLCVCILTTCILMLVYEYAVRYTWVGTMLNGKLTRKKAPVS